VDAIAGPYICHGQRCLIMRPQVVEYRKASLTEETAGEARAGTLLHYFILIIENVL